MSGGISKLGEWVLRNFLRQQDSLVAALESDVAAASQHPDWWLAELQKAWPNDWPNIVAEGNGPPPMGLRGKSAAVNRDEYQQRLEAEGIVAKASW